MRKRPDSPLCEPVHFSITVENRSKKRNNELKINQSSLVPLIAVQPFSGHGKFHLH